MSVQTKTQKMIARLREIVDAPFTLDAASEGLGIHGSLEDQWMADHQPKGHPGTLPVTNEFFRHEYERILTAGAPVEAQMFEALATYEQWHASGRVAYLAAEHRG